MKKILFLIPNLNDGGAEKVLVNLINNLDKNKYDITLQTIVDTGVNKKYVNSNIRYKTIFRKPFKGATSLLKIFSSNFLYRMFIEDNYDIEIAYLEGAAARLVSGKSTKKETKKVAWIHTEITNDKELAIGFRNIEEARKSYKKFDKIIGVSQVVEKAFLNTIKLELDTATLYNVNETEYIIDKSNEPIEEILDDKQINIFSVGKVIPSKNFYELARIHKRLTDEQIKNKVYILGKGNEEKRIKEYIERNGLKKSFIFLGYKENPYKYLKQADLYVCPSKKEGFSTAVTEALIVGTPVVTTPCAGMSELVGENNEYGIISKDFTEDLYVQIKKMVMDNKLRKYYKDKAVERGKKFSKERTVQAVSSMIDSL